MAERGSWSELLMNAHTMYKSGSNPEGALIEYLFLGELGYEVAQSNVGYILDQGQEGPFPQNETFQRALVYWNRAAAQGKGHKVG